MTPFSIIIPRAWNDANPDAPEIWPADYGVHPDHARDVLAGSYDCPYSPEKPPVCLDIGSNIGAFARWAAQRWKGCTLHCYEPQPDNFARLERTIARLKADQWAGASDNATFHLYPLAVGGHAQKALLNLHAQAVNCGEWSLFTPGEKGSVEVDVISAADLPKADVLKLDCEGGELHVLSTLHAAGRLCEFSAIMLETHCDDWIEPIMRNLTALGFTLTGRRDPYPNRSELRFVKTNILPADFQPDIQK